MAVACLGVLEAAGLYRVSFAIVVRDEFYAAAAGLSFLLMPLFLITMLLGARHLGPFLALSSLLAACFVGGARALLHAHRPEGAASPLNQSADKTVPRPFPLKRCADVAFAATVLVIALPAMIVAAISVVLASGRPLLFLQERVGKDNRIFDIYKFRTMQPSCSSHWAEFQDPRITRIGRFLRRFSLDELPQIFNVFRGEMSMVGPRPEMRSYAEDFTAQLPHYGDRHLVAPGITGWAQAHVDRHLDPSEAGQILELDLFYVRNRSLYLDLFLIYKTAAEFVFRGPV